MLVTPIVPAGGGNGLAMRAGMVLEALAECFDVDLVVVGVSGPLSGLGWARARSRTLTALEAVADEAGAREHLVAALADSRLRARLSASSPLPALARLAPPTLARELALAAAPRAVYALRGHMAPLGATLARSLGAGGLIVDLDDDDEAFARAAGLDEEADAIGRLARAWLPDADVVCAASAAEAAALAERYHLARVRVLPNAVRAPESGALVPAPGAGRLLFVGNLTYPPNLEAAELLAHAILPVVRESSPEVTLDLVGPHGGGVAPAEGVRVAGRVEDVAPWYAGCDVVVAPLRRGGGTRIKVLEALAHGRPVVATAAAVAGLELRDGREVSLGESPAELAARVCELLGDRERAAAMASAGRAAVLERYSQEVVGTTVRALVEEAAA